MTSILNETRVQQLVEALQNGEEQAFNELFHLFKKPVFYLSIRMVKNHTDADEIVQKTFTQAYFNIHTFRGESSFKTWLFRIVINACKDHLKSKEQRITKMYLEHPMLKKLTHTFISPLQKLIAHDEKRLLLEKINALSNQQKTTVLLRIFEEMAFKEIAGVLACSENTAKVHFHQAMLKLKTLFNHPSRERI